MQKKSLHTVTAKRVKCIKTLPGGCKTHLQKKFDSGCNIYHWISITILKQGLNYELRQHD